MNNYWDIRYKKGGDSGSGSIGIIGENKAASINGFIEKYKIETIADFGCGDGNIASMLNYKLYFGYDKSDESIKLCTVRFKNKNNMIFYKNINEIPSVDMCISIDVIYHIISDIDFEEYMLNLFNKSNKYVLIFSSDTDENNHTALHIKHRKFTKWINNNMTNFKLIDVLGNITQTSATMFLYKKINN